MGHVYILNKTLDSSPEPLPLPVRSLYSLCASLEYSDTQEIDNITYRVEMVNVDKVTDENVDIIFNIVSSDQDKFLLLKTNSIDISKTLIPPYPKKSFIIMCPTITGTGKISMTGKGPNVLPEDILLFESEEVSEVGRVLIPAYAKNQKSMTNTNTNSDYSSRKGVNGIGFNCGSGGIGAMITNSGTISAYMQSGSGYSYGGGAGIGCNVCDSSDNKVNQIYPMHGSDCILSMYYHGDGGVGNPSGVYKKGSWGKDLSPQAVGVGGRLIIFCNSCSIPLEAKGIKANDVPDDNAGDPCPAGGSSGGGSINVFYTANLNSSFNVQGGETSKNYMRPTDQRLMGGAGGNGTVVSVKCSNLKV